MTPTRPSDLALLRAVYRRLDRKALLAQHPSLTPKDIADFFRRLSRLIPQETAPAPRRPAPRSSVILNTDGGSRGNPGPAACGFVLTDQRGRIIVEKAKSIGRATSNQAEYQALIAGLEAALAHSPSRILIRADSELLIRQLNGSYKVKSLKLLPLFKRARALLDQFPSWRALHIPRHQNRRADALANQVLDRARQP